MAQGSLIDGSGQLKSATDKLEEAWAATREVWHDGVSRHFEEAHLEPLLEQVRASLDAIQRLSSTLVAACRACEDGDRGG